MRVAIKTSLLRWARDRSGHGDTYFAHRFPQLTAWLSEEVQPTTIYICQQRQEWYRDFARSMSKAPRRFSKLCVRLASDISNMHP